MIVVSACLAGVECRYNGQAFPVPAIVDMVKRGQAIPICPELLGNLPIPRPSGERREGRIFSRDGEDVTAEYECGAKTALSIVKLVNADKVILKSKSPTCGCGQIYDGSFSGNLIPGDGIFAELLKENHIAVYNENQLDEL